MFWNKENKVYEKLLRQFELVAAELKVAQKDIEIINIKLRKRVYKELSPEEKATEEDLSGKRGLGKIDDGMDELRKLYKP